MAHYKRPSGFPFHLIFWLLLLFLTSGIAIGTAQTIDRDLNGAIIFPDNQGVGTPGETVIYQHTIRNLGAGTDIFDLTAESSEGWSTNVSPEEVTLNGQEEETILVTIVVNGNAQPGDVDTTTVTVTSQSDPGTTDFSTDTTTVPLPMFLPVMANNAGQDSPDCQLMVIPPDNPPGVDLVVTAISLSPNPPIPGQEAIVRVTVKNQGMSDVVQDNNFFIDFYDDPSPEPPEPFQQGDLYWGVQWSDFPAGESETLTSTYIFEAGFHHLYAQVDTDSVVEESNEDNNIYGCLGITIN